MPFDVELAHRLTLDDRDVAPFFVGREAEIASFENALEVSKRKEQAVFRVYQGPPGCGKTSLAHHLEQMAGDNVLFVRPSGADMASRNALFDRIRWSALHKSDKKKATATVAEFLAAVAKRPELGDLAYEKLAFFSGKKKAIVIHIDEAHAIDEKHERQLVALHTTGIGRRCVVLFTGLEHTEERITSINGLSRLSQNAVVPMSSLEHQNCVESTKKMLRDLGGKEDLFGLAELSANLSRGWPAHLHSAQRAICENLIEVEGDYRSVDFEEVERRSDELRFEYYENRLKAVLPKERNLLLHIASEIKENAPLQMRHIDKICRSAKSKHGERSHDMPAEEISDLLLVKGIITKRFDGPNQIYKLAIPSMGEWAKQQIKRDTQP